MEPNKEKAYRLYQEYTDKIDNPAPIIKGQLSIPFYNTSKYDMSRLKGDAKNVKLNFTNYLTGYSQNVLAIIDNFQLDKPIEKHHKNNRLYQ